MKKNIYSFSGAESAISKSHSLSIGIQRYTRKSPRKSHISEDFSNFSVKLEKEDQLRYINSFLKKRMLNIWKGQRSLIHAAPMLPKLLEKTIYESVYQELKPLIVPCYEEDFHLPLISFTLIGWLQYSKLIAEILGKHGEAVYWDELIKFFQHCAQLNLLEHLSNEKR